MSLVILKIFLANLLNENVINISRFLRFFIHSMGKLGAQCFNPMKFTFELQLIVSLCITLIGNLSYGVQDHILFSSEANIICIIEMPNLTGAFLFIRISDMWLNILSFKQRRVSPIYSSLQALPSKIFFEELFNTPNIAKSKSSLLKRDFSSK